MKVHQKRLLDKRKIENLAAATRSLRPANTDVAEEFRIEAGCKTMIGSRLKRPGTFRKVKGANSILALRCSHLNGRFEDYREGRRTV